MAEEKKEPFPLDAAVRGLEQLQDDSCPDCIETKKTTGYPECEKCHFEISNQREGALWALMKWMNMEMTFTPEDMREEAEKIVKENREKNPVHLQHKEKNLEEQFAEVFAADFERWKNRRIPE